MSDEAVEMNPEEVKAILEALIYVADEPVREEELLGVFPAGAAPVVRQALEDLVVEYDGVVPRGLRIVRVAGGYLMQTRPEHDLWIRSLYKLRNRVRLSHAALETLAIIAYRQPVTTPEIQSIRSTSPIGVLQTLLERRLIKVLGRKKVVGKPILYGTTSEFLAHFGLYSLADLPTLEEFGDLNPAAGTAGQAVPRSLEGILSRGPEVRADLLPREQEVEELFCWPEVANTDPPLPPAGAPVTGPDEEE